VSRLDDVGVLAAIVHHKEHKRVLRTIGQGKRLRNLAEDWVYVVELAKAGFVEVAPAANGQLEIKGLTPAGRARAADRDLTLDMARALLKAERGELQSWDFGSATLGALKAAGLVARVTTHEQAKETGVRLGNYRVTEMGRAKIEHGRQGDTALDAALKEIGR